MILVTRSREDPDRESDLLNQAADYAVRGNHNELAYRAIESVPIEDRDVSLLRKLATLARGLPTDSKVLQRGDKTLTPIELSSMWESSLRKAEGENGTYWRFSRASTLVYQIYSNPDDSTENAARLKEVENLHKQISSRRPLWGPGIALGGWISAIKNDHEEAVTQLRRGITAGDRRIQSRMLLVEQLNQLGRFEEAEQELQLAGRSLGAAPETMPQIAVDLAQRQGDFRRSVAMARMLVDQRPDDAAIRQLLAQSLSMAAQQTQKPGEADQYIEEGREALEKAVELSDGADFPLAAARMQFEFAHGDHASQRALMNEIATSPLSERQRLDLLARGLAFERREFCDFLLEGFLLFVGAHRGLEKTPRILGGRPRRSRNARENDRARP